MSTTTTPNTEDSTTEAAATRIPRWHRHLTDEERRRIVDAMHRLANQGHLWPVVNDIHARVAIAILSAEPDGQTAAALGKIVRRSPMYVSSTLRDLAGILTHHVHAALRVVRIDAPRKPGAPGQTPSAYCIVFSMISPDPSR